MSDFRVISDTTVRYQPPAPPDGGSCRVYWGTHGCEHPRGHPAGMPHECDCCTCASHPDPDPDNPDSEPSCVAGPPYYGPSTLFYGEDTELYGLPVSRPAERPAHPRQETCRYCSKEVILGAKGWRLDSNHPSGYDCEAGPHGRHGVIKPQKGG